MGASISISELIARARRATELHAVEQVGLLRCELLLGDHSPRAQLVELLDLLGDGELCLLRDSRTTTSHPVRVRFHLAVDLVLHDRRLAHVFERLRAALPRRLDAEVARTE